MRRLIIALILVIIVILLTNQYFIHAEALTAENSFIVYKPPCCATPYFSENNGECFLACDQASQPLSVAMLAEIKQLTSIRSVQPILTFRINSDHGTISITGFQGHNRLAFPAAEAQIIYMQQGRFLKGENEILINSQCAERKQLSIGQHIHLKGREFTIVGIVQEKSWLVKSDYFITLKSAHELMSRMAGFPAQKLMNILIVQSKKNFVHQAVADVKSVTGSAGIVAFNATDKDSFFQHESND